MTTKSTAARRGAGMRRSLAVGDVAVGLASCRSVGQSLGTASGVPAGMIKGGDGGLIADPLSCRGSASSGPGGARGLNAEAFMNKLCPRDDTDATDDVRDCAHGVVDSRGMLLCSCRVPAAMRTPRRYHHSSMVTRTRRLSGGREVVDRVSFETRECDVGDREAWLRRELDLDIGYAGGSVADAGAAHAAGVRW